MTKRRDYTPEMPPALTGARAASRRDELAASLMGTFLAIDRPSTFSSEAWRVAVEAAARRAVDAADILVATLDGATVPYGTVGGA